MKASEKAVPADPFQASVHALVRRYAGLVYAVSWRYAHQEADADDIAQQIWVRVMKLLPDKDPEAPMGAWFTLVAAHTAMQARGRWLRHEKLKVRFAQSLTSEDRQSAAQDYDRDEWVVREVRAAVEHLPSLRRQVVLERVFEDLSVAETSDKLDRAPGTVKASCHQAKKKLAKELQALRALWEGNDI